MNNESLPRGAAIGYAPSAIRHQPTRRPDHRHHLIHPHLLAVIDQRRVDRREEGRSQRSRFVKAFFPNLINECDKNDSKEGREPAQHKFAFTGDKPPSREKEIVERRVNIGGGITDDSIRALESHLIAVAFIVPQRLDIDPIEAEEGRQ